MIKFLRNITFLIIAFSFFRTTIYGNTREGYDTVYGSYKKNNLEIISYSKHWDNSNVKLLYNELLNNFYSDEISSLSQIIVYPDSPDGVMGNYYEDIKINSSGGYTFGNEAYIELFNGDRLNTAEKIAPYLSHEYGHHYTLTNMIRHEDSYYTFWATSEYAKIRQLNLSPVIYNTHDTDDYVRIWDIAEIVAIDYVQLLGSENAKKGFDYLDSKELAETGSSEDIYTPIYYNAQPQENLNIPLATEVDGLYNYFLKIGGYTGSAPFIDKKPEIKALATDSSFANKTYTLTFDEALGNAPFEYTVIMHPTNNPLFTTPLKTLKTGDKLKVIFGTYLNESEGKYTGILDYYLGEYMIKVYAKDAKGFTFESEALYYDFGEDYFDINSQLDSNRVSPDTEYEPSENIPNTKPKPTPPSKGSSSKLLQAGNIIYSTLLNETFLKYEFKYKSNNNNVNIIVNVINNNSTYTKVKIPFTLYSVKDDSTNYNEPFTKRIFLISKKLN